MVPCRDLSQAAMCAEVPALRRCGGGCRRDATNVLGTPAGPCAAANTTSFKVGAQAANSTSSPEDTRSVVSARYATRSSPSKKPERLAEHVQVAADEHLLVVLANVEVRVGEATEYGLA